MAYFNLGIFRHDNETAFATLVLFYMMKINKKGFVNADELCILRKIIVFDL